LITAVIVQARMGSSRLPGKVLLELGGQTVLAHVLQRCRRIPSADLVVCAVPDEPESEPVEREAKACGAVVFRGSEKDVLARYLGAARYVHADCIMRVTSDCPLIDSNVCGAVLTLRRQGELDYAANNIPRTFPHGLDCEAFTTAALAEAAASTDLAYDREHVTPWLRRAAHLKRGNLLSADAALASHRWTLDYPEDLTFLRAVVGVTGAQNLRHMNDVLSVLEAHPELAPINACRIQP